MGISEHILLVLLAVHPIVHSLKDVWIKCADEDDGLEDVEMICFAVLEEENGHLTGDTVGSLTKRAFEDVHVVLNHRPAGAVWCLKPVPLSVSILKFFLLQDILLFFLIYSLILGFLWS